MKDKEDEDSTAMVLRGATYEEAVALVAHINCEDMHVMEVAAIIDPILAKYGWSFLGILTETIKRRDVQ